MADDEERKYMEIFGDLSNHAVQEYEGLQREHERAEMECKRMQLERDEAVNRLKEFQRVSHMVIEEVNTIQENLEIERTCRENVEELASKLKRENRSLKRKSMLLFSHLGPETIAEISLEDEEKEEENEDWGKVCSSAQCQSIITELSDKLRLTLEEKKQVAINLEATTEQLKELKQDLQKERHDNTVLIAETVQQKKHLAKYNRVSLYAVEEYESLQENLNLEKDLRAEAESFARQMLVEQKKLSRQSQVLLQTTNPSEALQSALSEVTRLTEALERNTLEHQQQMKVLEDQLRGSALQKEVLTLQRQLELVEEERNESRKTCIKAEGEAKDLRHMVEELQKKLQAAMNPPLASALPPPPPPPPPPPISQPPSNPLSALLSMLVKRKDNSNNIPLVVQDSSKTTEPDIRQQAVDEMMQRIKKGVALRPVGQSPNRARPIQRERVPSNSAIHELKGILETIKRPSPQPQTESPSTNNESELERILQRRRGAFKTPLDSSPPSSPKIFPSSVLDLTRVKQAPQQPTQTFHDSSPC